MSIKRKKENFENTGCNFSYQCNKLKKKFLFKQERDSYSSVMLKSVRARPSASEEVVARPRNILARPRNIFARPSPIQVNPSYFSSFERRLMVNETF